MPCDSPFLPTNLATRLLAALQQQKADIAIACTGEFKHPRAQPVLGKPGQEADETFAVEHVISVHARNECGQTCVELFPWPTGIEGNHCWRYCLRRSNTKDTAPWMVELDIDQGDRAYARGLLLRLVLTA